MKNFSIINNTKSNPPLNGLLLVKIKNAILGERWNIELALVTPKESLRLNSIYRKKSKPANVLSFRLSSNEGQIIICPSTASKQAEEFSLSKMDFINYLFIHGLLHLKGLEHGSIMENKEKRFSAEFIGERNALTLNNGKKNLSRNRHRNLPGESDGHGKRSDGRSHNS